mmetsp:Transcript_32740/g.34078  ORF Transcript_32740/g.34078 Transcript_32740/m.34078 type:complete len:311 (-) Transcript_32740:53-985(-)
MTLSAQQYEKDAAVLRKAMEGWGTDEGPIIEITARRSNADRQQILKFYKASFGRDALEDLEDELGGNLRKVVLGMYKTPLDYDTTELYKAMKGGGTDEDTIIEIIGTRTNSQLIAIKDRFKVLYKEHLENWINDELGGDLKRLVVSLIQCNRSEECNINADKLDKDLKDLYEAGEGQWGTDESVFNKIFTLRSPAELRYINREYLKHVGRSLFEVVDDEFSGDMKKLLKTVLHAMINTTDYYAERIRAACKGWGTNDEVLIRCLVSRDEIDLKEIKAVYPKKFGKSIYEEIKDETSGDYKKILLAIAATD